jgi:hypothetical protein
LLETGSEAGKKGFSHGPELKHIPGPLFTHPRVQVVHIDNVELLTMVGERRDVPNGSVNGVVFVFTRYEDVQEMLELDGE